MIDVCHELATAPGPDLAAVAAVTQRAGQVLRPRGAFERLDQVAAWLAGWQRTTHPAVTRPSLLLAAADHGVTAHDVSAYPATVTQAMVDAITRGVATSSVLARQVGVEVRVLDVGVGVPTGDLTHEPALTPERFAQAVAAGRMAVAQLDCDLLVLGEMGIGNTTAAAAVAAALVGGDPADWVGPGTGLDEAGLARKRAVVAAACTRLPDDAAPWEILRQVGGAELATLAGACAEARLRSIPVVLDGFVVTAAVTALEMAVPGALAHCVAGHCSPEPGHRRLLDRLGLTPLLDLGLRLGEGSGALLAVPLLRAAAAAVVEVATFEEWGVTG